MNGRMISLLFVLVILSISGIAVKASNEVKIQSSATINNNGEVFTMASSSGGVSVSSGDGKVSLTSQSMSEATVKEGSTYTINLNENPSNGEKWTVTHSDGLKILSDKLDSEGTREIKVLAVEKGTQTLKADYSESGKGKKITQTVKVTLNVV